MSEVGIASPIVRTSRRDIGFAVGMVAILAILFLPIPAPLVDLGLALSIALSVLILMVTLWIQKPLEFSSFPTVLLIATLLRLALGIATTRLILSDGGDGVHAAGHIISGFAQLVMGGDFVIGIVVFAILITVNFLVITKGATRIAEVGARFTLDAIPGKQMAIDADLNAGLIDDKEAQRRRYELEEESSFFGSMDGASKFVRGEAVASLIIIAVNIFGGILIGVTRHGLALSDAADVFTRLSVGDGLVSQIPALIISLAAGLLVSKGGTRGSAEKAIFGQLGAYPRALYVASGLMLGLALVPGLPLLPFATLGGLMAFVAYKVPLHLARQKAEDAAREAAQQKQDDAETEAKDSVKESLRSAEVEIAVGKQLATVLLRNPAELAHRIGKMRRKFAERYGFVVPDIKVGEALALPSKSYQIRMHGTAVASQEMRIGEMMVVVGDGPGPDVPGDETREPAFGMKALWVSDSYAAEVKREGFTPIDAMSIVLTHLSEAVSNNLSQLLSYKAMRALLDRLDPEYKRLIEDICPAQISHSGLQAVLKLLLAERVSIRNLHLILEAVAEIVPHARRTEHVVEHVRMRMAQQICGDLSEGGVLRVLRLGGKWDLTFHESLKRDAKGEAVEFDIDPRLVEQFGTEASAVIREKMRGSGTFALLTAPDARPYVRMIVERMFPSLPVLSHVEIARGVEVTSLGAIS
ncbi:flagellar biosynthesis protein FlhA [Ancylobacter dichloromethanicus]|uniref:Flagellar biosynthesis protein FlhA n=1 Tax=Ancylobacter dichloromethanicus TaxID=518825 RepID=A0A9W6J5A7_9HYPH|nr:flagellar biosynthesis protein FlhA [Ancylobacter dichloromethanicus]MBS7556323.1 flagellar biosynthesis protein FlhA [Ancylobacter dichloromethanicus]GLK70086.1 flagellar biosynthesis protein FlhA [Ancylobacter dichloromethanicus]